MLVAIRHGPRSIILKGAATPAMGTPITPSDNDYVALDSTLVRAHQQAATGKGGGQKGGIRLWGVPEAD